MIDELIAQKQVAIPRAVSAGLIEKRKEAGLSPLMPDSGLALAAGSLSDSILTQLSEPKHDHISADYRQRAYSAGYWGTNVGTTYYRKTWLIDTPNELIVNEYIDFFLEYGTVDFWEDMGLGFSWGHDDVNPHWIGICAVIGLGCTDGNALVTNFINDERMKQGVKPLSVNYALRLLARKYLAMDRSPDRDQIRSDIWLQGYAHPAARLWFHHTGVYAPMDTGRDAYTVHDFARLVADQYLLNYRDVLLSPRWTDVGFAVSPQPVLPTNVSPSVPSFASEFVIAKQIPQNFTGLDTIYWVRSPSPPDPQKNRPKKRRRWWPF